MRLVEFSSEDTAPDVDSDAVAIAMLLKGRAHDFAKMGKMNTVAFIKLMQHDGIPISSYDMLSDIFDESDALKNIISSIDKDFIKFKGFGDEEDAEETDAPTKAKTNPEATVSKMAKRALHKRA